MTHDPTLPRRSLLDWMPVLSFGFVVLVQAIVFVWFMAGLDARSSKNAENITELQIEVREIKADRTDLTSRMVRVETLLTEILNEVRKSP